MSRADILFIEQFYYPEGWGGAELPRELTMHLARCGWAVEVICGGDQYVQVSGESGPDPEAVGVGISRLPSLLPGEFKRWKFLRQFWFYVALVPALALRRRPRLVMAQTNPPFGVVLAALASLCWRRPLIVLAMDIYPDVLVAHGILSPNGLPAAMLGIVFRWAYRRARYVVSLGPVMTERLRAKGVTSEKIREIANWSTGATGVIRGSSNRLVKEWGLEGRFVILYSGNLGVAHEFETFLRGFSRACDSVEQLRMVIVGMGSRLMEVVARVETLGISKRVSFHGFVPSEQLPESLGVADVALVTLRIGFEGLVVPSKLYGYMSRGIPVLYVGPRSDSSIVVQRTNCGWVVEPGAEEGVTQCLLAAYADRAEAARRGSAGAKAYSTEYSSAEALENYESMVADVLRHRDDNIC